ncbi:MAG: hypothetical protein MJE68_23810 [Proteobacteria bacterium]|nr:hypothetical protein [Pseudomonadota bacterium]
MPPNSNSRTNTISKRYSIAATLKHCHTRTRHPLLSLPGITVNIIHKARHRQGNLLTPVVPLQCPVRLHPLIYPRPRSHTPHSMVVILVKREVMHSGTMTIQELKLRRQGMLQLKQGDIHTECQVVVT